MTNSATFPRVEHAGVMRAHYSAEEKIRIVLEGLRGEDSIAISCPPKMLPFALLMSSSYLSSTHHFALNSVIQRNPSSF